MGQWTRMRDTVFQKTYLFTIEVQLIEISHILPMCSCVYAIFFLLRGSYERWESRGHSDGKSKKCDPLRRGLSACFCREGKTLGTCSTTHWLYQVEEVIWVCWVGNKSKEYVPIKGLCPLSFYSLFLKMGKSWLRLARETFPKWPPLFLKVFIFKFLPGGSMGHKCLLWFLFIFT